MHFVIRCGCLLMLGLGMWGCFSTAPDPTPTLDFFFATITPASSDVAQAPSPTRPEALDESVAASSG